MVRLEQAKGLEAATQLEGPPGKMERKFFASFFQKRSAFFF